MFARAKQLPYLLLATGLLVALVVLLFPNFVHAFIGEFVYKGFVVGFLGWLMSLAGNLLNYAINAFVIGFGGQFQGGVGFVVNETWATIRDLFNLTFIFGLVFIGFKMILRTDDSNSRKWLVNIILAALLVNFSLFITKFVIDFSNIVAVELINMGIERTVNGQQVFSSDANGVDLSSSMNNMMKIQTVFSTEGTPPEEVDYSFSLIFGTAIVFLVTTFVYISAALMIVVRAAVLVILMILSPFLFIGMVFPNLQGAASKIWHMLITRAAFAPIYIALLYITLSVAGGFTSALSTFNSVPEDVNFANAFAETDGTNAVTSTGATFGPYLIIIALLVISLVAAQKLGAEGASSAIKVGNNLRRGAQKQVARGAGGVAARGVARGAEVAERNYNRLQTSKIGRYMNETRTGKAIKAATKGAAAVATLGASTAILSDKNIRGAMKSAQKARVAGSETLEEQRKREAGVKRDINDREKQDENTKQFKETTKKLADVAASSAEVETAMQNLAKTMKNMSSAELSDMKVDELTNREVALNLTDTQIDSLEKSGNYSNGQILAIKEARKQAQINVAMTGAATVQDETAAVRRAKNDSMRNASNAPGATPDQIAAFNTVTSNQSKLVANADNVSKMSIDVFTNPEMYRYITPNALEKRLGDVNEAQRIQIRDAISVHLGVPAGTPPPAGTPWDRWYQRSPEAVRLFS